MSTKPLNSDDYGIDELPVPATLADPGGADFVEAVGVANAVNRDAYGDFFLLHPAEQLYFGTDPAKPLRVIVARSGGAIVGRASLSTLTRDPGTAWITVEVLPEHRRRGIGTRLLAAVEDAAARVGATKFIAAVRVFEHDGPRLTPPTGYGSMPAQAPNTLFLHRHGYTLEQIIRASRLELPVVAARAVLEESQAYAGADYVLHQWVGATPPRWLDDMGSLTTRMSTDVPSGELAPPEDAWTAERVAEDDARREALSGLVRVVSAVEHAPSAQLVGYSELLVPADPARDAYQWFTVAAPEHRGHRLGTLLKAANLIHLGDRFPDRPGILTGNAEENRPMLDINERLGFRPIGYESEWKKE